MNVPFKVSLLSPWVTKQHHSWRIKKHTRMLPLCAHGDSSTTVCSWDRDFGSDEFIFRSWVFCRGPSGAPTPTSLIPRLDGPNAAAAAASPAASELRFPCRDGSLCKPVSCYQKPAELWGGPTSNERSEVVSIHLRDKKIIYRLYKGCIFSNILGASCLPFRQINSRVILRPTCKNWITIPVWATPICRRSQ